MFLNGMAADLLTPESGKAFSHLHHTRETGRAETWCRSACIAGFEPELRL
jgi:hypothetical protein